MTAVRPNHAGRAELLRSMIAELDDTIEHGLVLPPHWYTDADVFAIEQPIVTRQTWQYLGHADQLPSSGHFITNKIGDVPVVVVHADGGLRGYVNVCRHRGHLVARGEHGTCSTLQCHYHGWTWSLDGELRGVPRANREPSFDKSAWPLVAIQVATWGKLVFGCLDLEGPSLEEFLGEIPQHALARGHDPNEYRLARHDDLELPCNWKVFNDNMVECYHCPTGHPAFRDLYSVEPENYVLEVHNMCGFHSAALKDDETSQSYQEMLGQFEFYFLFPTTMIMYHEIAEVMIVANPVEAERTSFYIEYHYRPDADPEAIREFEEWYEPLWGEDMALIAAVQAGIRAGAVPPGPLLLDSEVIVQQCQRWLRDTLAQGLERIETDMSIPA